MFQKIIKNFARLKFYTQRTMVYYQLLTSFAIWVMFIREYNPEWWIYVCSIMFLLFLVWIIGRYDRKLKILQYEQTLYNQENKEITEILKTVKELQETINKKKGSSNE